MTGKVSRRAKNCSSVQSRRESESCAQRKHTTIKGEGGKGVQPWWCAEKERRRGKEAKGKRKIVFSREGPGKKKENTLKHTSIEGNKSQALNHQMHKSKCTPWKKSDREGKSWF